MHSTCRLLIATLALLCASTASAIDTDRDDVRAFIDEMVEQHGFDRTELVVLLGEAEVQEGILEAMRRPAERTKPWHEYRDIFIQPKRVNAGVAFWAEHADAIERISADTGVPAEILVGIIGVETYYGRITGKHRVLDALVTLGFDYPPRAKFFRKELGHFLQLAREEAIDPRTALGSYAGAMGAPQFIPSSYRAYADDGDGDGRKDLFNNWDDVLASVAEYFRRHRWKPGAPVVTSASLADNASLTLPAENKLADPIDIGALREQGLEFDTAELAGDSARVIVFEGDAGRELHVGFHNFYVITRYNRSTMYAMAVWQLGNEIAAARHASEVAAAP